MGLYGFAIEKVGQNSGAAHVNPNYVPTSPEWNGRVQRTYCN